MTIASAGERARPPGGLRAHPVAAQPAVIRPAVVRPAVRWFPVILCALAALALWSLCAVAVAAGAPRPGFGEAVVVHERAVGEVGGLRAHGDPSGGLLAQVPPDGGDGGDLEDDDETRQGWGRGRSAAVDGDERPVDLLRIDDPDERARALERSGWQTSGLEFRPGNAAWGLIALTGGFLVHGAGHQGVGETATARRLLVGQAIAIGLMASGLVLRAVSPGADGTQSLGGAALAAGGGMYVAGWLTDVVGTFKGTAVPLPDNALELRGVALEVFYTSLFAQNLSLTSVGVARVRIDLQRVSLVPEVQFGPSGSYWRYGSEVSLRFPVPPSRHELRSARSGDDVDPRARSFWGPWLQLHEDWHQADGWGQDVIAGGLALSLDLGRIDTNLRGLVWDVRVGVGGLWTFLELDDNRRLRGRNARAFMPVETAVSMNVSRGLSVALGYRHRPDHLVGGLWLDGGMFYQRFTIVPVERLGIEVTFEEGEFVRLWAGLRYYLSTQSRGL